MNHQQFLSQLKSNPRPVVVDFWAPWCGPCTFVRPVITSLKKEYKDRVDVWEINADESPELMQRYGVTGIPTLIVFDKGEELERYVGARNPEFYGRVFTSLSSGELPPHEPPASIFRMATLIGGMALLYWGSVDRLYFIAAAGTLLLLITFVDPAWAVRAIQARLRKTQKS